MTATSTGGNVRRLGLRTTITASFALGALLLSVSMALGTYLLARNYLVDQRERTASRQAFTHASSVRDGLLTSGARVSDVLGALSLPSDGTVVVRRDDTWFSSSLDIGEDDIPAELREMAADGSVGLTWQDTEQGPAVVVAVPLPAVGAHFFERVVTTELSRTLDALRIILTVFAVLTAIAGALLGRWAARRVVAPLDRVAGAAARIAAGSLDTRLDRTDDPDLATIVASFNSMVDAVNDRIARDARFAADVSHELRSPLTALVTSVDVLHGRRDELPARSQQALDLIRSDLSRFQRVLEDLLDLGRLEAGAAALVLGVVDARALTAHAMEAAGVSPERLASAEGAEPATVRVDKSVMHRALVNLLENGERHGGGVTGVTVTSSPGAVVLTVDDEGPGVPRSDRTRIFERFVRGGSRGSLPGAGLGLSLVAETVRAHGGTVRCSDGPAGSGSRFTVQLPAADRRPSNRAPTRTGRSA
ncbi:MAG TPA: HAMP domain-containing sensor histidine kinase [Actinomycetes bacterium]